jgi:hypothetical protein
MLTTSDATTDVVTARTRLRVLDLDLSKIFNTLPRLCDANPGVGTRRKSIRERIAKLSETFQTVAPRRKHAAHGT